MEEGAHGVAGTAPECVCTSIFYFYFFQSQALNYMFQAVLEL